MLNLVSLIIGAVALVLALIAFLPLLGWANWLIIPLAIIGAVVGMASRSTAGPQPQPVRDCRRRGPADARRRHPVSRDPQDRRLYRQGAAVRAADPRTCAGARAFGAAGSRGDDEVERSGLHARRQDRADDGGVQSPCGGQFLAREGASRRGGQRRGHGAVRQAQGGFRPAGQCRARPADPQGGRSRPFRSGATPGQACESGGAAASRTSPPRSPRRPRPRPSLDGFTPGARREYLDWIAEAKRDETRAKRIATAVEWLSEGKKKHWKYENC